MKPEKFTTYCEVPRELFGDKAALEFYIQDGWLHTLKQHGGEPVNDPPALTTQEGTKFRKGEMLLWGQDDTDWDIIQLRTTGAAYKPDTPVVWGEISDP